MTHLTKKERITNQILEQITDNEEALELFQSGELLRELNSKLVHRIFDAEMDHHLAQPEEQAAGNIRNGHNEKTVYTDSGTMALSVPRDRHGTFHPQLVEKYVRTTTGFRREGHRTFCQWPEHSPHSTTPRQDVSSRGFT